MPQEYWRSRTIFSVAGSLGIPICLDDATNKKSFGHYARVLVDIDLKKDLDDQVLVERKGFAFFVRIEYEKLPPFCSYCQFVGHSNDLCKRQNNTSNVLKTDEPKKTNSIYVPKLKPVSIADNGKAVQFDGTVVDVETLYEGESLRKRLQFFSNYNRKWLCIMILIPF